jgi:16S rRNA (guanine966-N2)-methyltransferase
MTRLKLATRDIGGKKRMIRITSGAFKGRRIATTSGPGYRPATEKVREALLSMLEARLKQWEGIVAADIFAGSGSLGFEALSRGARRVHFLENNSRAAKLIRSNARQLDLPQSRVRIAKRDAFRMVCSSPPEKFGLAFIDPPYKKGLLVPFLERFLHAGWMQDSGLIAAEVEQELSLDPERFSGLELLAQRTYGQTRIYLWRTKVCD